MAPDMSSLLPSRDRLRRRATRSALAVAAGGCVLLSGTASAVADRSSRDARPAPEGSSGLVITPDDIVVGARRNKRFGCEDKNPNHPENVSHCGWPQITGMFFNTGETNCGRCPTTPDARLTIMGTPGLNDLLLGGRGDVTIVAGDGDNVLWADRVPHGPASQRARISAGDGDNIIYAGPGTNTIVVGTGRNVVHAWQGSGSVTCASKRTVVRMMDRSRKRYDISGCSTARGY